MKCQIPPAPYFSPSCLSRSTCINLLYRSTLNVTDWQALFEVPPPSFPISQMNMQWKVCWWKFSLRGWPSQAGNLEVGPSVRGRLFVVDESIQLVAEQVCLSMWARLYGRVHVFHLCAIAQTSPPLHLSIFLFFLSVVLPTRHLHPNAYTPSPQLSQYANYCLERGKIWVFCSATLNLNIWCLMSFRCQLYSYIDGIYLCYR